jgi:serine/threonine protein kinase/thioredoxin-like negative regulator of GroEL
MALPVGTILDGKFKIVKVLGEGGMGTVYKVEQVGRPGQFRAVKELLISPTTTPEERKTAIERFNKEIDLLFGLKHPRIPSLILSFQERGNYYFVMEFVPGQSLDQMLEQNKGPLDEEKVIKWMMQVCEALSYIHSRNPPIILRDLKPGNVMVTPEGDVQLIDFGIARRFDPNKRTNTENLGTISYASPEHLGSLTAPGQRRSAVNPGTPVQTDARSDIYSLGATMYHLLTNYEPDPIQTPASGSILAKNPKLRTIQISGKLICPVEQVIIKAMQQEPAKRFQSAEAMRMALQSCLPNYSLNAAPATIQIPAVSPNATIIVPTVSADAASGPICPKCGYRNRPGAKFCKRDAQPLTVGATSVPPPMHGRAQAVPPQPIRARPVQSAQQPLKTVQAQPPIQARPAQPIRARPVQQVQQSAPSPAMAGRQQGASSQPGAASANDAAAAYQIGLQHLRNKNYTEAVNQILLAQRLGYALYDVLFSLGRAYRQHAQSVKEADKKIFTDKMKLAAEQFEQALKQKPGAFEALFQLGMCYYDLARYQEAERVFQEARKLRPDDTAIYYQLGLVAMKQGYAREAISYFLDGLKISPNHIPILISLGNLYADTRQFRQAVKTLQDATQIDANLWDPWYELGRALMKAGEWKQALDALEKARQRNDDLSDIYAAMATCYQKLRKKQEAREMVREAFKRDPTNAEALQLQKLL